MSLEDLASAGIDEDLQRIIKIEQEKSELQGQVCTLLSFQPNTLLTCQLLILSLCFIDAKVS